MRECHGLSATCFVGNYIFVRLDILKELYLFKYFDLQPPSRSPGLCEYLRQAPTYISHVKLLTTMRLISPHPIEKGISPHPGAGSIVARNEIKSLASLELCKGFSALK